MLRISVIIPVLNESVHLPGLLAALNRQTRLPDEIIVADAGSVDDTVTLASANGAHVVRGGMPGPGRNAGARVASGDIFLFLDADVLPCADFVERALEEFTRHGYVVATCLSDAATPDLTDKLIMEATNLYLQIIAPISPRAPGYCMFALNTVHKAIGGFDESLRMSEDHDYVRRAGQHGRFGVLTSTRIRVSMRRLEKEGLIGSAFKYLWCEMYALAGKPIRSMPFEYEFGHYAQAEVAKGRVLIDIAELRARLGSVENPIQSLSNAGSERWRRLMEFDPMNIAAEQIRLLLERRDIDVVERYVRRRLTVIQEHKGLSGALLRLKALPSESIRMLEIGWLYSLGETGAEMTFGTNLRYPMRMDNPVDLIFLESLRAIPSPGEDRSHVRAIRSFR